MATSTKYTKSGTVIRCDTSVQPRNRVTGAWPIPAFPTTGNSFLSLTLAAIAQDGSSGINIATTTTLPGPVGTWTLYWYAYQGSAPTSPTLNPVDLPGLTINLTLPGVMASATFVAYLQQVSAGQTLTYASATISTPVNVDQSTDGLSVADQILLIQNWKAALATQTSLAAQAVVEAVSSVALATAMTNLSNGLIAAGAGASWATAWPSTSNFYSTGITTSLTSWWAAITTAAEALRAAIAAVPASNDYLDNAAKIVLVGDWNAEAVIKISLDASAVLLSMPNTSGTPRYVYDAAVAAISTNLIAAGAPAAWATSWPDGATWSHAGIKAALAGWWTTVAAARAAFQTAIGLAQSSAAQAAAISDTTSRALLKLNFATSDGLRINGTTLDGASITSAAMSNSNSTNLIPNGNSETPAPAAGWPSGCAEASGLVNVNAIVGGAYTGRSGANARMAAMASWIYVSNRIAASPGDQFYGQAWAMPVDVGGVLAQYSINYYNAAGVWQSGVYGNATVPGGVWSFLSISGTVPAGCAFIDVALAGPGTSRMFYDDIYLGKVSVAGMLAANSVISNNIAANTISTRELICANATNLIPNPNSDPCPSNGGAWPVDAYENAALYALDPSPYGGTGIRKLVGTGVPQMVAVTGPIPCKMGDTFTFLAGATTDWGAAGHGWLVLNYLNAAGALISTVNSGVTGATWAPLSVTVTATDSATNYIQFCLANNQALAIPAAFAGLIARQCSDASVIVDGTLTALFSRFGNSLASTNNNHGLVSSSVAPVGVYQSGVPFTTTFADGTWTAGSFVVGQQYRIISVGTTTWASCGTSWIGTSGVVGSIFTATAIGAGTGTAAHVASDCVAEWGGSHNLGGFQLSGLGIAKLGFGANSNVILTSGTTVWTAPQMGTPGQSYKILVTVQGGGASGMGGSASCNGGGGGGHCSFELLVRDGSTLTCVVGAGGATSANSTINAGGTSTVTLGGTLPVGGLSAGLLMTCTGGGNNTWGGNVNAGSGPMAGFLGEVGGAPGMGQNGWAGGPFIKFLAGGPGGGVAGGTQTGGNSGGWQGGTFQGTVAGGGASPFGPGGSGNGSGIGVTPATWAYGAGGGGGYTTSGAGAGGVIQIQIL